MTMGFQFKLFLFFCLSSQSLAFSFGRDSREKKREYTESLRTFLVTIDRSLSEAQTQKVSPATVTKLSKLYQELSAKVSPQRKADLESALVQLANVGSVQDGDRQIRRLRSLVIEAFRVVTVPSQTPNYQDGEGLYKEYCEACHGGGGVGDGKLTQNKRFPMVPAPTNVAMLAESGTRTVFGIYNLLLVGIEGSMEPYDVLLKDEERWDLAFYLMAQPFSKKWGPVMDPRKLVASLSGSEQELLANVGGTLDKIANMTDIEILAQIKLKRPQIEKKDLERLIVSLRRGKSFLADTPRS